jgi:hypothetical protein
VRLDFSIYHCLKQFGNDWSNIKQITNEIYACNIHLSRGKNYVAHAKPLQVGKVDHANGDHLAFKTFNIFSCSLDEIEFDITWNKSHKFIDFLMKSVIVKALSHVLLYKGKNLNMG